MRKTMLEILEETVAFYSEDPDRRGTDDVGTCVYFDYKTKKKCAVGRCLDPKKTDLKRISNFNPSARELEDFCKTENIRYKFKDGYQSHSYQFWDYLQKLHDDIGNWSDTGLTHKGKQLVKDIKCWITSEGEFS